MSNYQMQEGQFTLFKNNKTTNNAPEYTGEIMVNGMTNFEELIDIIDNI